MKHGISEKRQRTERTSVCVRGAARRALATRLAPLPRRSCIATDDSLTVAAPTCADRRYSPDSKRWSHRLHSDASHS
eukprot:1674508-Prymnesium_polylepis.1